MMLQNNDVAAKVIPLVSRFLDFSDLCNLAQTCKTVRIACEEDRSSWERLLSKHFEYQPTSSKLSPKAAFADLWSKKQRARRPRPNMLQRTATTMGLTSHSGQQRPLTMYAIAPLAVKPQQQQQQAAQLVPTGHMTHPMIVAQHPLMSDDANN